MRNLFFEKSDNGKGNPKAPSALTLLCKKNITFKSTSNHHIMSTFNLFEQYKVVPW